jgi:hypothetical protein
MTQKLLPEYLKNSLQNTLRTGYMFVICYFVVILQLPVSNSAQQFIFN